ncbi:MAG: hypothetical protein ACJ741_17165, partial [Pyrinomonadaceae bacterium]
MKKRHSWKHRAAGRAGDAAPHRTEARAGVASPGVGARRVWRWRGVALDVAVVAAQMFLLAPLARMLRAGGRGFLAPGETVGGTVSPQVGWLFLSVFAAHAFGAYLKRLPKAARLAASAGMSARYEEGNSPARKFLVGVACALLLAHFLIFMSLLFAGWQSTSLQRWSPLFGSTAAENTYGAFFVRFILIIFVMPLPTALVLMNLGGGDGGASAPPAATWRTHPATELCADLLLYFSVIVITVILNVVIAPRFLST